MVDGFVSKVFYLVFPADKNVAEVIAWLRGASWAAGPVIQ